MHELHFSGGLPFTLKVPGTKSTKGKGQPSAKRGGQNVSNYSFPIRASKEKASKSRVVI